MSNKTKGIYDEGSQKESDVRGECFKVCLMGASLETGNMGVSALAASLIKIIKTLRPDAHISFLIGNKSPKHFLFRVAGRDYSIELINFRLSVRAKPQEHLLWIFFLALLFRGIPSTALRSIIIKSNLWLRTLWNADLVGDIHGGDSFSDIYGMRRFLSRMIPNIAAILMGKRLVLLPQTYGPYVSTPSRLLARFVVSRSSPVLSRDFEGIQVVRALLGESIKHDMVAFCPDVAFALESVEVDEPNIQPKIENKSDLPLVGLNVNGLLFKGGYTGGNMFQLKCVYREFAMLLAERLLTQTQVRVLLIPHTYGFSSSANDDPEACASIFRDLTARFPHRIHLLEGYYNQSELKGIIRRCDFFVGSRMHSCIAALSQMVPTVGVAYSRKFKGVFESVGAGGAVIDLREIGQEDAIQAILVAFKKRHRFVAELEKNLPPVEGKIMDTFCGLLPH